MNLKVIYEPAGRALEYAPLAVSAYRGCAHGCIYCFAPASTKRKREMFLVPSARKDFLKNLESDLIKLSTAGDSREVLMSFTTDPYQPCEEWFGLTRASLKLFNQYGIHYSILTKGGKRSMEDLNLISERPDLGRYATTLTLWKPEDAVKWEPQAAPWPERIMALKRARELGIRTWVSIEPVIDPAQSTYLIAESLPYVDEYRIGTLNHMKKTVTDQEMINFVRSTKYTLSMMGKSFFFKKDAMPFVKAAEREET
jgi:DNA repair photolyase